MTKARHLRLVPPLPPEPDAGQLVRNAARCERCGAELESTDADGDAVTCRCGDLSIFGGLHEAGRSFNARPGSGWTDLSEYADET